MYTGNDALFCLLHSCYDGLSSGRLTYYIYLYQVAGLNFNFKYKVRASGVDSRAIDDYLNIVMSEGKIEFSDNEIKPTQMGYLYYLNVPLTYEEWEKLDNIKVALDSLSDAELYLIVITDLLISDVRSKLGVNGLITQKEQIKSSVASLCKDYSEENFDDALKLLRLIRDGGLGSEKQK